MFHWTFSSRKSHGPLWYLCGIIVVLSLIVYGIIEGLYLMSIVIFLFAGVYILMENNTQPISEVLVDDSGIRVENTHYPYAVLDTFAIIAVANIPRYLRIYQKKKIGNSIDIPLSQDVNPQALREYLLSYLTEEVAAKFSNSDAMIHAMRL